MHPDVPAHTNWQRKFASTAFVGFFLNGENEQRSDALLWKLLQCVCVRTNVSVCRFDSGVDLLDFISLLSDSSCRKITAFCGAAFWICYQSRHLFSQSSAQRRSEEMKKDSNGS